MKKKYLIFGMTLVLGFIFMGVYSFERNSLNNNRVTMKKLFSLSSINSSSPSNTPSTTHSTAASKGLALASAPFPASFKDHFEQVAQSIGQTTANTQEADQAVTNLALKVTSAQLNELYSQATSQHTSGDEKLLATELLIRSPLAESLNYLKKIVNSSAAEKFGNSPTAQQEFRSIQMSAIEGLGQKPQFKSEAKVVLKQLSQTIEDSLLLDRIQRTRYAIDGKVPAPEIQDQRALERVLRRH